jgi:hypothetical protein
MNQHVWRPFKAEKISFSSKNSDFLSGSLSAATIAVEVLTMITKKLKKKNWPHWLWPNMLLIVKHVYSIKISWYIFIIYIFLHLFSEEVVPGKHLSCPGQLLEHSVGVQQCWKQKVDYPCLMAIITAI